jgi:Ferric reductase like transmembrane component
MLASPPLGRLRLRMVCPSIDHSIDSRYTQVSNQKLALLNTLKFSVWASRGAGLVLAMDGFLIMLAVCRNLITWLRPKIRFLPLDENLWFHRQTAYMLLLFTIIHTTAHYVNFFVIPISDGLTIECRGCSCTTRHRFANPLRRCWRDHRPCHAFVYAPYVYDCTRSYSKTILRSILVHASSRLHLCVGFIYSCNWMFCPRYYSTVQSICRGDVLDPLHWIRRMEIDFMEWWVIFP